MSEAPPDVEPVHPRTSRRLSRLADAALARPGATLVALAVAGLVFRLFALGARTFHWDEARVGYWTLRYLETGTFWYRPIIHGPFLPIVNRHVFAVLGATDVTARLVVALVGGTAPLAAWLFRDFFDDAEILALGAFLAFNPLLLYYSRFMRADVPLAVFALFALGFVARALVTGRRRYVLAAGLAFGFALTTKENVLVYLACWLGAAAVVFVVRLLPPYRDDPPRVVARRTVGSARRAVHPHLVALVPALALALVVVTYFYAPRGAAGDPPLAAALADPTRFPAVVEQATLGSWDRFAGSLWASSEVRSHPYLPFLVHYVGVLAVGGATLYSFAAVGTLGALWPHERRRLPWRADAGAGNDADPHNAAAGVGSRDLAVFGAAWGVASVLGYPLAADIMAAWLGVHVLVALAFPAAVGAVAVLRWTNRRRHSGNRAAVTAVALAVLILVGQTAVVGAAAAYTSPTPRVNLLAQGAQPGDDLDPLVRDIEATAATGAAPGLLYYGEHFYLPNESLADDPPEEGEVWPGWWLSRLPVPWYTERAGVDSAFAWSEQELRARESYPPVVVTTDERADDVAAVVPSYQRRTYDLTLHGSTVVVFTDESRLDGAKLPAFDGLKRL